MGSFIQNVNDIAAKLPIIEEANSIFDEGVIPVLEDIAMLDLSEAIVDLKKGTFFGNRKIDIDLSLNKQGIVEGMSTTAAMEIWENTATTVYYASATVTFVDGVVVEVPFVNDDLSPITISNHGTLVYQLLNNTAFTTKLTETGIFDDIGGETGVLVRIYDIVGQTSNIERIQLHAVAGSYIDQNPVYFWGKTTSAFQTLSMRTADIIKLGDDIDSIILLANRITEMLALQAKIPEFVTNIDSLYANIAKLVVIHTNIAAITNIHTNMTPLLAINTNMTNLNNIVAQIIPNIAEILAADTNAATATAKALEAFNSAAAAAASASTATTQAGIATTQAGIATTQAGIATTKANAILGLTTQATTGAAGSLASASYNPVDGKMTFSIPQGNKGDKGDAFDVNSVGLFAGRNIYDAQPAGFSFLALDLSLIYFKLSATSGDWSAGAPFGKGDTGATGATGNGIASIAFLSTTDVSGLAGKSGATDTYRITNTDATKYNFLVYNGIDAGAASTIAFTPNGDIAATNVQAAIQEVRDDTDTKLGAKADQGTTYTKSEDDAIINAHKTADDHTQYHNDTRGDARYSLLSHTHTLDAVPTDASTNAVESNGVFDALALKQATLVSGTNIKTVGGVSLLGSGDIALAGNAIGSVSGTTSVAISGLSLSNGSAINFSYYSTGSANVPDITIGGATVSTYNMTTSVVAPSAADAYLATNASVFTLNQNNGTEKRITGTIVVQDGKVIISASSRQIGSTRNIEWIGEATCTTATSVTIAQANATASSLLLYKGVSA